jgi:hypothetical protein
MHILTGRGLSFDDIRLDWPRGGTVRTSLGLGLLIGLGHSHGAAALSSSTSRPRWGQFRAA